MNASRTQRKSVNRLATNLVPKRDCAVWFDLKTQIRAATAARAAPRPRRRRPPRCCRRVVVVARAAQPAGKAIPQVKSNKPNKLASFRSFFSSAQPLARSFSARASVIRDERVVRFARTLTTICFNLRFIQPEFKLFGV